jgi:uncharacterized protein (DUF111 family)
VILYLDCLRGINAPSMLAALIDAGVEASAVVHALQFLPGKVVLDSTETVTDGFRVRGVGVGAPEVPDRRRFDEIVELLERSEDLSAEARKLVRGVYERLASAEARVHGSTIDAVTFHEVGRARSVVSVIGIAVALDLVDVRGVIVSPVPIGNGIVETDHGRLPVPAPATLELLRGVPVVETGTPGELVTPTGAAIVTQLATSFGPMPSMTIERIGYGSDEQRSPALVTRAIVGRQVPRRRAVEEASPRQAETSWPS